MSSLSSMPYEILSIIFFAASQHDRASLALLNKRFHQFAEPLLYRNIEIKSYRERFGSRGDFRMTHLLLRTIVKRPDLAGLVRHVEFGNHGEASIPCQKPLSNLPARLRMQPEDYEAFASIVEGLNLPDKALWKSNLEEELDESRYEYSVGFASALGPILISQLPFLRSVNLGSSWNKLSHRVVNSGAMFRSTLVPGPGNPHPSHCQKLERVEAYFPLYGTNYRGNLLQNTQEAMSFFYLPALKDLRLLITNTYSRDGRSTFEWPAERPPPTKIRTLVLEALGEENLGDILSLTPKIQKLEWIHWYSNKVRGNFSSPVIDCDTVIEALSLVQDVLEDLTVQADLVYRDKQPVEDGDGVKGSLDLRNFDKLRKIEAPLILLLGIGQERAGKFADVLPRNVQEVTINADYGLESLENLTWDPQPVIDTFRTWLADSRTVAPHLTRINVFWPAMEGAKELEELFSEARIQYVIYADASDPPIYLNNYRMYPPADGQYDAEWEYRDIHFRLTNKVSLASILAKNSSEAVKQGLQNLTIS